MGEIMIQYSIISEHPLRATENLLKNLSIKLKLKQDNLNYITN